jgi:hypothetical protein
MAFLRVAILALVLGLVAADIPRPQLVGDINAVRLVIDRVLGCDISHKFDVAFDSSACTDGAACWTLSDSSDGRIAIRGSTASESTAAIGFYLRNFLNLTIGWPRGGGSYVTVPTVLPRVGRTIVQQRNVPWSYIMNGTNIAIIFSSAQVQVSILGVVFLVNSMHTLVQLSMV